MIREEILNAKLIVIIFIFISFACIFDLPYCTSTLMLMMMKAIMKFVDNDDATTPADELVNYLESFAWIMKMLAVLT